MPAADGRVHVGLDLGLAEGAVIDADLVDHAREGVAAGALADGHGLRGVVVLACWDRADEDAVIQNTVHEDAEASSGGVVDPGNVVPGAELAHGVAVALGEGRTAP